MLAKSLQGAALATQPVYIEDTFSTYLYTGNGSTQTITNGIDLAGKGGLVWVKQRNGTYPNVLSDSAQGFQKGLVSNSTDATDGLTNGVTYQTGYATSTGLVLGSNTESNASSQTYASWTFRKQAKFFDVVTYTGNGTTQAISHNLGSAPGCVIIKRTSGSADDWYVWHRSTTAGNYLKLNLTNAQSASAAAQIFGNNTTTVNPTSTSFTVGNVAGVNANTSTFVAYLFAHNAGGFGASGTDNVISCGSLSHTNGAATTVNLGYEPQFVIFKGSSIANDWFILDSMRGMTVAGINDAYVVANTSDAESTSNLLGVSSTGFEFPSGQTTGTYIYIAIRRPMKTPTSGTSVFSLNTTAPATNMTVGFPADFVLTKRTGAAVATWAGSRLQGSSAYLLTSATSAEASSAGLWSWDLQNVFKHAYGATPLVTYLTRRAPGFFDVVCYTGTGSATAQSHNLGVSPELTITKARTATGQMNWYVGHYGLNQYATSITTAAVNNANLSTFAPVTATTFVPILYANGASYVTYLFASVSGVSKVGSYTGNGSSQTINCGFAAGARFVMIKRTDSTGDWYVWDTVRGIVAGNDPHLSLNTTEADVTTDDTIDPDNSGFIVNQVAATNVNVNTATYIYLAIA